jgi:hypothetical protein
MLGGLGTRTEGGLPFSNDRPFRKVATDSVAVEARKATTCGALLQHE